MISNKYFLGTVCFQNQGSYFVKIVYLENLAYFTRQDSRREGSTYGAYFSTSPLNGVLNPAMTSLYLSSAFEHRSNYVTVLVMSYLCAWNDNNIWPGRFFFFYNFFSSMRLLCLGLMIGFKVEHQFTVSIILDFLNYVMMLQFWSR